MFFAVNYRIVFEMYTDARKEKKLTLRKVLNYLDIILVILGKIQHLSNWKVKVDLRDFRGQIKIEEWALRNDLLET